MKNVLITVLVAFMSFVNWANAQVHEHVHDHPCGTMEYLKKQLQENPSLELKMKQYEEQTQKIRKYGPFLQSNVTVTIPVVVHILYNTESQNISDERVFQQIQQLNEDFAGLNPNPMGAFPLSLKANTSIKFCLAQTAPDGSPTNGIQRRQNVPVFYYPDNGMKFYKSGGLDAWDPNFYLNIWVCLMQGVGAFGQFPGTGINETYGVATNPGYFGLSTSVGNGKGHILAHEIGHCLNLRHIWADDNGACTGSDFCEDTPNQANYIRGDNRGIITDDCTPSSPGVMYMNFMDYANDDTYSNFTPDQNARMWASLNGPLASLTTSTVCNQPSGCESPMNLNASLLKQTNAVLNWSGMVNSVSYNIRYRKVKFSSWTTINSATNSVYISGLQKNTSYEFQVQSVYGNCSSEFSYIYTFKTPMNNPPESLAVPLLVSPENNADNVSINPSLMWNSVTYAQRYTIQFSANSDFSYVYFQKTFSGSTFIPALSFNRQYYWRVRAETDDIIGDWSERTFTTGTGTLNPPILLRPSNNAQNVVIEPSVTLFWDPGTDARGSILQYSINSDMSNPIEPGTNYLKGLAKGTTYYWRVKAVNNDITSDWSEIWNFTTDDGTLAVPTLLSPVNNAINVDVNPTLIWNNVANATEYKLQYSINVDFTDADSITTSYLSEGINSLNYETKYFWRVKAANSDTVSEWSETWNFTTGGMALDAPILSSPPNNLQNVSTMPTLSWNSVNGATSYNLHYSTYSDFNTYEQVTGITNTSVEIGILLRRTTYFWRVNAQNESITSEWSEIWKFKTTNNNNFTDVNDNSIEDDNVNLKLYPNPFTDETMVEFTLPVQSDISLKIYNLNGDLVSTIYDGIANAGTQSMNLSGGKLPSGEYTVVLSVGNEKFVKKVLKIK